METTVLPLTGQPEYPLLGDRVQSTFIDTILLIILMFILASILDRFEDVPTWVRIALFVGLWGVYEPICTTLGATFGNYIKKIRVRQVRIYSKRINFFQAFVRYLLKLSLGWISFLTIHSNRERRAIHDLAAGSVMIKI
ncbi:MAG TPA: RDD family protein [Chitinophagaceae bacterium]|nr:RDD family protein [Chitinophagaceae bacterium]